MGAEDRVVTTEFLVSASGPGDHAELQVGSGVLADLDPDGLHVLVPTGHVSGPGSGRIVCEAQLAICGEGKPTLVDVLVSTATFTGLPSAFQVLRSATSLIASIAADLDADLEGLEFDERGGLGR